MSGAKDPWTDAQVRFAYEAASKRVSEFDVADIREILRGFRDAGVEVSIPALPAFWVHENYQGHWFVIRGDGTSEGSHVAYFDSSHPSPEAAAHAEARRLNEAGRQEPAEVGCEVCDSWRLRKAGR